MQRHPIESGASADRSPQTDRRSRLLRLLLPLLVAALAILPYLNSLPNDFTFDDPMVVRDNPVVSEERLGEALRAVYPMGSVYRPLTMASYVLNHRLGERASAYRLINIALHALATVALYFLALALLGSVPVAALAAALFAVHPIHTEVVNGIVGRSELLAAVFGLGCLLSEGRAATRRGPAAWRWHAIGLVGFAAALLSKESALTLIPLVALVDYRLGGRTAVRSARQLSVSAAYAGVGVGFLLLRMHVVGALGWPEPPVALDNPLAHVDVVSRVQTAAIVLVQYLSQLTVPLVLCADYSYNEIAVVTSGLDPRWPYAAAMLVVGGGALALLARRAPVLALSACFVIVPLALTANVLLPIGTIKAERLLYLPSVGWCLAVGWLAVQAMRRRFAATVVAVGLILTAFAARTWMRNRDWRDARSLYAATVATAPDSAKAHHNLAVALELDGELDEAMLHFRRALEIYPDYAAAAYGIGHVYTRKALDVGAAYWYEETLRRNPHFAKAHLQLGMIHQRRGDHAAAAAAFIAGLESEPANPLLLVNLAAARLSQGDRAGAREALLRLDGVGSDHAVVAQARREIEVAIQ